MKKTRKLIAWVLILVLSVSVFIYLAPSGAVKADSNDRRRTFIKLAQGKNLTAFDPSEMTAEELRVISYYLSNFYIPLKTHLVNEVLNGSTTDAVFDQCVQALQAAGVEEETAKAVLKFCMKQTILSMEPVYMEMDNMKQAYRRLVTKTANTETATYSPVTNDGSDSDTITQKFIFGMHGNHGNVGISGSNFSGKDLWNNSITAIDTTKITTQYNKLWKDTLKAARERFGQASVMSPETGNDNFCPVTYPMFAGIISSSSIWRDTTDAHAWQSVKYEDSDSGTYREPVVLYRYDGTDYVKIFEGTDSQMRAIAQSYPSATGDWLGKYLYNDDETQTVFDTPLFVDWTGTIYALWDNDFVPIIKGATNMCTVNSFLKSEEIPYHIPSVYSVSYNSPTTSIWMKVSKKNDIYMWDNNSDTGSSIAELGDYRFFFKALADIVGIDTDTDTNGADWYFGAGFYAPAVSNGGWDNDKPVGAIFPTMRRSVTSATNCIVLTADNYALIDENTNLSDIFKAVSMRPQVTQGAASMNMIDKTYASSLFLTYAFGSWNSQIWNDENATDEEKDALIFWWRHNTDDSLNYGNGHLSGGKIAEPYMLDFSAFPEPDPSLVPDIQTFAATLAESADIQAEQTRSFIYYLLHPTEGLPYITTWVKNKLMAVLLGWHEDIVGGTSSNSTTGMTAYLGFSGYTTTPAINDLEWMEAIVSGYDSIIVYILILLILVLLCYLIVGQLSVGRAIIGFVSFAVLCFLPPLFINSVVNMSNEFSMGVYTRKFNYWAITQTEQYLNQLASIEEARGLNEDEYLQKVVETNRIRSEDSSKAANYSGVRLKWMSAKKANGGAVVTDLIKKSQAYNRFAGTAFARMVSSVYANAGNTEVFVPDGLYLYRDQLDIYRVSAISYNLYSSYNYNGMLRNSGSASDVYSGFHQRSNYPVYARFTSMHYEDFSYTVTSDEHLVEDAFYNETVLGSTNDITWRDIYRMAYVPAKDNGNLSADDVAFRDSFLYNNLRPAFAVKQGFLFGKQKKSRGYLSSQTLALGYLLRYDEAVKKAWKEYSDFKKTETDTRSVVINGCYMQGDSLMPYATDEIEALYGLSPSRFSYTVQNIQGRKEVDLTQNFSAELQSLGHYYYGLYTESPFYYFNWNIRDQLNQCNSYDSTASSLDDEDSLLDDTKKVTSYSFQDTNLLAKTEALKDLWLYEDQAYFYNYTDNGGYGELRDFMNLRNLFYYVIPELRYGVELSRDFDKRFGVTFSDDSVVKLEADGSIRVDGVEVYTSDGQCNVNAVNKIFGNSDGGVESIYTEEQRYQIWHDLEVIWLYYAYSSWVDTMMDCEYAEPEVIKVMGKSYTVEEPLNPYSYFKLNEDGTDIVEGREMVFSRTEMAYYGLNFNDLTTVEQKCITLQDNVYAETLSLMNYYTFSDEVLIQAYSLIQLFEFNKIFSQDTMFKTNYIMYPQGYELKAFSYDAYMRMILASSTGEDLQVATTQAGNQSIYSRIGEKTSLFFGILLLINDVVAVYIVPLLKVFFIVCIFFISIALILGAAVKVELNILKVLLRSLIQPLGFFLLINVGFSYIVSLFLDSGAEGVVKTTTVISLGDPTMACIAMLIINVVALVLYFKLCKKSFQDLKTYVSQVFTSIGGAVGGAVSSVAGVVAAGGMAGAALGAMNSAKDGKDGASGVTSTNPAQRGSKNMEPTAGGTKTKSNDGDSSKDGKSTDKKADKINNKYDEKINKARGANDAKQEKLSSKLEKTKSKLGDTESKLANNEATGTKSTILMHKKNSLAKRQGKLEEKQRQLSDGKKARKFDKRQAKKRKSLSAKSDKYNRKAASVDPSSKKTKLGKVMAGARKKMLQAKANRAKNKQIKNQSTAAAKRQKLVDAHKKKQANKVEKKTKKINKKRAKAITKYNAKKVRKQTKKAQKIARKKGSSSNKKEIRRKMNSGRTVSNGATRGNAQKPISKKRKVARAGLKVAKKTFKVGATAAKKTAKAKMVAQGAAIAVGAKAVGAAAHSVNDFAKSPSNNNNGNNGAGDENS